MSVFTLAIAGLAALALFMTTANAVVGAVPRRRVEEFARLHSLPVTAGNGNQIIVYRATTRRWRTIGFVLGLLVSVGFAKPFTVNFLGVFAGWFAGAAVAELRVAHLDRGPRAAASLAPRRVSDYLPRLGRWAVPGFMGLCVLTGAYCVARHGAHPVGDLRAAALWTAVGLVIGVVALAAQRYVLQRPQPLAGPDRLAADDAIRSRSMHVFAAAGMVLIGSCVGAQIRAADVLQNNHLSGALTAALGIGVAILGRILAYWPSGPRGGGPGPSAPAVSEPA